MTSHGRRMRLRGSATAVPLTVAATMSACTSAPSTPVNSPAQTSTSPPASTTSTAGEIYTSDRLGYRLRLPPGWTATPAYLDWELSVPPTPGTPFVDTLTAPAGTPFYAVGRQQRPSGETLGEWLVKLQSAKSITYPDQCTPPTAEADTSLGSEPAKSFSLHCPEDGPDAVGVQVLAMHSGFGYLLFCYDIHWGATRTDELVNQCREWSTNFTYLPA